MNKRLEKFRAYSEHAWFRKVFKRLKKDDIAFAELVLNEQALLDKNDFELMCNRLFMDKPNKPKNWKEIQELLANSNS